MENLTIHTATSEGDIAIVRNLWQEYWSSMGLTPDFHDFAKDVQSLPGAYGPPRGFLLLAYIGEEVAGTAALRPLSETSCEAKRLYIRPQFRRHKLGRFLMEHVIQRARSLGYQELYGDSLPVMAEAQRLYTTLGFEVVGPYSPHPTPGAIYLKLSL